MKKLIKYLLIITVLVMCYIVISKVHKPISRKIDVLKISGIYRELAKECQTEADYECCIYSVGTMDYNKYKPSENNACEEGYKVNTIRCGDSHEWCEPVGVPVQGEKRN